MGIAGAGFMRGRRPSKLGLVLCMAGTCGTEAMQACVCACWADGYVGLLLGLKLAFGLELCRLAIRPGVGLWTWAWAFGLWPDKRIKMKTIKQ